MHQNIWKNTGLKFNVIVCINVLYMSMNFKNILRKLWFILISALCWILYHSGILKVFCSNFFKHRICVVMCHGVNGTATGHPEDRFCIKADCFRKFYSLLREISPLVTVQDLERMVEGKKTRGGVLFTFDEAYLELADVLPMLIRDGCGVILFAVQSATEAGVFMTDTISNGIKPKKVMSCQELRRMSSLGATVGSHTVTHPNLCAIPEAAVANELMQSKDYFESIISKKVKWFAYPGGCYNSQVINIVSEAGYTFAVTVKPGFVKPNSKPLEIPRIDIRGSANNPFCSLACICGLESRFRRKFYGEGIKK